MSRPLFAAALALAAAACGEPSKPSVPASSPAAPPPAAATSAKVDPAEEAAASYRVAARAQPGRVRAGGAAEVLLAIEVTRPDVHVQAEFPLKVALQPSPGLRVEKATLGHADAVDPGARGREWRVKVTGTGRGPQRVEAALRFAVCKESEPAWCVTRNETIAAPLEVR